MKDEEMAEEWVKENMDCVKTVSCLNHDCNYFSDEERSIAKSAFKDGYNKAKEEAMMKLKDEGIVKPLKESILRNQRLSSQEQQELCEWIECAMDFGENLENKVEHHQEVIDTLQKKLKRNCTPEETMELEERIHTLEVYLEGAINFLILDGDVDNPIIKSVEDILHITFNKNWR